MPLTSQYSGLPLAATTSVEEAIAVGYCGFAARSVSPVIAAQLESLGLMIGLIGASLAEAAIIGPLFAPATPPPADPRAMIKTSAAATVRTDTPHARRPRIRSSILSLPRCPGLPPADRLAGTPKLQATVHPQARATPI